ncbi:MAG: glycerol-3-phosphate 1-O-acyltransferase PlsY [Candidatus Omnitrophota bacterium]
MYAALLVSLSYLLGSIPFGLVIAYLVKKIDIRKFGSGNIGATNVVRVVGKSWGIFVFVLDFLKGFLPVILAKLFLATAHTYIYILIGLCAVCGHNWPIFLKFKGGKGVATTLGVVCGLSVIFPILWIVLLLSVSIWAIVFFIFRYVSLASILLAVSLCVFSFLFPLPSAIKWFLSVVAVFILIRHKKNIKNLLDKKEHRF